MLRTALIFGAAAVLLGGSAFFVGGHLQVGLGVAAAVMGLIFLFFLAHWALEKASPAPYEPFLPNRRPGQPGPPAAGGGTGAPRGRDREAA